jgi:KaiC/GvpD/RAD55 family RecA-like ATPase
MKVKLILDTIKQTKATALLTSEIIRGQEGYSRDTLSEFLCDAIIVLHSVEGEDSFRTLTIPKMRLTKQKMGIYSFEIGKKGFIVKSSE